MNILNGKPNELLYLPPALGVGVYLLVFGSFPLITIIFFCLGGLTGAVFGSAFYFLFRGKKYVREWSLLLGTWVAVTSVWIYEQFYDSLIMLFAAL